MGRLSIPRAFATAALLLVAGLAVAPDASFAQDYGTPAMQMGEGHPAHIHDGTCANLGGIAYPLNNLTHGGMMGTPMAGMMEASPMAGMAATPMAGEEVESQSTTKVDTSLDDLLGEEYAINVHESMEKIDVYIACGDLTGTPENGKLQIELKELNNSGVHGWARLMDNGDGTTTVDAVLFGMHGMMGTPEASPAP